MRVNDYPYGKVTKTLKKAVSWLNNNKRKIVKEVIKNDYDRFIDWPDYWDMPKTISSRLNTDELDFLQFETGAWFDNL